MPLNPNGAGRSPNDVAAAAADLLAAAKAVDLDAPDPCMDCACCAQWSVILQVLGASAKLHVMTELRLKPCHDNCLICHAAWAQPEPM